jgi:hypothetical protein
MAALWKQCQIYFPSFFVVEDRAASVSVRHCPTQTPQAESFEKTECINGAMRDILQMGEAGNNLRQQSHTTQAMPLSSSPDILEDTLSYQSENPKSGSARYHLVSKSSPKYRKVASQRFLRVTLGYPRGWQTLHDNVPPVKIKNLDSHAVRPLKYPAFAPHSSHKTYCSYKSYKSHFAQQSSRPQPPPAPDWGCGYGETRAAVAATLGLWQPEDNLM